MSRKRNLEEDGQQLIIKSFALYGRVGPKPTDTDASECLLFNLYI